MCSATLHILSIYNKLIGCITYTHCYTQCFKTKQMDKNFEIGKIITIDNKYNWKIIAIAENCSDGLRFDIQSINNEKIILHGCWLWDADWHCV